MTKYYIKEFVVILRKYFLLAVFIVMLLHSGLFSSVYGDTTSFENTINAIEEALPWYSGGRIDVDQFQKSFALIQKEAALHPSFSQAHMYLGLSYVYQGVFDKALSEYSLAAKWDAMDFVPIIAKGDLYAKKRMWDDALKSYQNCVFRFPYPLAYQRLVEEYSRRGQTKDVYKSLLKWISVDPKNSYAHFTLAQWFEKTGKIQEALKEYDKIGPEDMEYYEASKARIKLGMSQEPGGNEDILRIKPLTVYEEKNRRNPFEPYTNNIDLSSVDINNLELTGYVAGEEGNEAIFRDKTKPGSVYLLRKGRLLDNHNWKIKGVTGIIDHKDVILTQGNKEINFNLKEGEE